MELFLRQVSEGLALHNTKDPLFALNCNKKPAQPLAWGTQRHLTGVNVASFCWTYSLTSCYLLVFGLNITRAGFKSRYEVISTECPSLTITAFGRVSPYLHSGAECESSGRSDAAPSADGVGRREWKSALNCPVFKRETKRGRADQCLSDHVSARLELRPGSCLTPRSCTAALTERCRVVCWKWLNRAALAEMMPNAMPLLEQDAFFCFVLFFKYY